MDGRPSDRSGPEHRLGARIAALAVAGPFVLLLVPGLFIWLGGRLDAWAGLAPFIYPPYSWIAGGALGAAGFLLGFWAVEVQVDEGRGTPLPVVPTRRLLVTGPYRYCRNPMTLGTIGLYKGIAVVTGSWGAAAVAALFLAALLLYIRFIEEKELAARFGAEYEEYRRRTAFIIPGIL